MPTPQNVPAARPQGPQLVDNPGLSATGGIPGVAAARELFWQNVMREILTSLSVSYASRSATPEPTDPDQQAPEDPFDGRLAVITTLGQRVPIAAVYPLFACGIQTSDADKALSTAVECTVFQIHTPGGEVYTLPLHEMRGFHSLSEPLIEQIKQSAQAENGDDQNEPFGFAAYTSLARTNTSSEVPQPPL